MNVFYILVILAWNMMILKIYKMAFLLFSFFKKLPYVFSIFQPTLHSKFPTWHFSGFPCFITFCAKGSSCITYRKAPVFLSFLYNHLVGMTALYRTWFWAISRLNVMLEFIFKRLEQHKVKFYIFVLSFLMVILA